MVRLNDLPSAYTTATLTILALLASGAVCPVESQDYVVDQSHDEFTPSLWWSVTNMGPLGQEFTPTLALVDRVEFYTKDFDGSPSGTGTVLQVLVREGSIGGSILGASVEVPVENNQIGPVLFEFTTPAELVPGGLYVLELLNVGGPNWAAGEGWGYPEGRAIIYGEPYDGGDLWFREGWSSSPVEPSSWGKIKVMYR